MGKKLKASWWPAEGHHWAALPQRMGIVQAHVYVPQCLEPYPFDDAPLMLPASP